MELALLTMLMPMLLLMMMMEYEQFEGAVNEEGLPSSTSWSINKHHPSKSGSAFDRHTTAYTAIIRHI